MKEGPVQRLAQSREEGRTAKTIEADWWQNRAQHQSNNKIINSKNIDSKIKILKTLIIKIEYRWNL
jgi:hypothetical protein